MTLPDADEPLPLPLSNSIPAGADTAMSASTPFHHFPKHLLIELAKTCMEIVQAILDLGVPRDVAQLFAKEFPQQFGELIGERASSKGPTPQWLEDTCILIQHIENPSEEDRAYFANQPWGWQENPPLLTSDQLSTALQHGATFKSSDKGFDLFQRMDLSADQIETLTRCVDVLAQKNKA
jgi:hypothetical protein